MKRPIMLAALTGLSACSLDPHYARPQPAVPPTFPTGASYAVNVEPPPTGIAYRDIFKDAHLQQIIAQSLANNQDLRQALANVASARAQYRVQRSELLPTVQASGSVARRRTSSSGAGLGTGVGGTGNGLGGTGTGIGGTGLGGTGAGGTTGTGTGTGGGNGTGIGTGAGTAVVGGGNRTINTYQVQAGTSAWEIDLFGRLGSLTRSAFDLYLAQEGAARSARLALVAEVANTYLLLAADRSLLAIADDTARSAQESVRLTQARLDGGVAPRTDLRQAQTVLATAQADQANATTAVAQDRNALELLVGAPVADALLPQSIEAVDGQVGELPAGLDSAILLRRPDVVQAEYQLRAANARIGAARAAFLPRISLTSLAGFASTALSALFTGGAFTWSVAPTVSQTIFDGGALRGNLAYAQAQRDVSLAVYQRAIQTAFRETADQLARRGTIDRELAANRLNVTAADDNYTLGLARYRGGIDPYLNTLDAQRTLYSARRTLAQIRLERAQNLVTLYQVLGGDELLPADPDRARTALTTGAPPGR